MTTPNYLEASHPDYRSDIRESEADREPQTAVSDDLAGQIVQIALCIDANRRSRRPIPSDRAWVKTWPALGSPKTWSRILAGDLDGISLEAKIPAYRGVLLALQTGAESSGTEELYEDLAGAQETSLAVLRLMHHHGKDRFILIEGGSGSGKTSAIDLLASGPASGNLIRQEADETWKSIRVAIRHFLDALGVSEAKVPAETGAMLDMLVETLRRRGRVILAVDEAHHVTGPFLNLCKTLLNRTQVLFILAGMETLLRKLRASASEEARQLFHNRLFCRVRLSGPDPDGARLFLARRLRVASIRWSDGIIAGLTERAKHCGHWSYLRRVCDQLAANGTPDPDDAALLAAAEAAAAEIA